MWRRQAHRTDCSVRVARRVRRYPSAGVWAGKIVICILRILFSIRCASGTTIVRIIRRSLESWWHQPILFSVVDYCDKLLGWVLVWVTVWHHLHFIENWFLYTIHETLVYRVSCILIYENTYTKNFNKIHDNTRIALLRIQIFYSSVYYSYNTLHLQSTEQCFNWMSLKFLSLLIFI